jgi:hypothetical protein
MPPQNRVSIELEVSPPDAEVQVIGVEPVSGLFQKGGFAPKAIALGRFQLDLLQGPDYHILAQAPGFRSDILPLTLQPGKPPPAEPLRITLLPSGAPIEGGGPVPPPASPALRVGLEQTKFEGDPLSAGKMADMGNRIRQAIEAYFLTETQGLELLSEDTLDHFLEAKEAVEENLAQQTAIAVETKMQRLRSGPDVLVRVSCIASRSQPDPAALAQLEISLKAKVFRALSGLLVGSKFVDAGLSPEARTALEEILNNPAAAGEIENLLAERVAAIVRLGHLGEAMTSVDDVAAGGPADADQLPSAARRVARQIAYRLHTLYPSLVFPSDLPPEYEAILLHIGAREADGYPAFLEQEPGDRNELLGRLDAASLSGLTDGAQVIAERSLNGQIADDLFLTAYGQTLYRWIEPLVGERLKAAWEIAQAGRRGLRLRLCCDSTEIQALPWEYMFLPWLGYGDDAPAHHVGLRTDLAFSRYLVRPAPVAELLPLAGPLRTLVVIPPSPPDLLARFGGKLEKVNGDEEAQSIQDALSAVAALHAEEDIRRIEPLILKEDKATWNQVQNQLQNTPYSVFHFIGHGWKDDSGSVKLVGATVRDAVLESSTKDADDLQELFLPVARELRLVLLQSCASGSVRPELAGVGWHLAAHVPVVVAMQHTIGIDLAQRFAHAFYTGLALGHEVDVAAAEGRHAIAVAVRNSRDWGTPIVYMQRSGLFGGPPILASPA